MRCLAPAILALLLGWAPASATPPGFDLSWDDCGLAGAEARTFACDTNTGEASDHRLVVSFYAPAGVDQLVGLSTWLELRTSTGVLPDWWQLRGSNQCRNGALSVSKDPPDGTVECATLWPAGASGGITSFDLDYGGPGAARLSLVIAVPDNQAFAIEPGAHYAACQVVINSRRTVGTDACEGCLQPVCFRLGSIDLTGAAGAPIASVRNPAHRDFVFWQGRDDACLFPNPARRSTWGAIKAIYR